MIPNSTGIPELVTGPAMVAWQRLLRAKHVIGRDLDAELQSTHGMTLSDYDVLIQLRDAEAGFLRMGDLSLRSMLTKSGMTRLVQGLERDSLIERMPCDDDARVCFVRITDMGRSQLAAARVTHHQGIRRLFADKFTDGEAEVLAELIGRIPGVLDAGPIAKPDVHAAP